MKRPRRLWLAAALALSVLTPGAAQAGDEERLTVFAAASLADAMAEIAGAWEEDGGRRVALSLAGSSTLARQIAAGAPADVFVSASPDWMDAVADAGRIVTDSRADIASNRLVVIRRADRAAAPAGAVPAVSAAHLDADRIAMALVEAVPAGIYGREALGRLGLWQVAAPRVVQAADARAALAMVAVGAAPAGIVYATDAAAEPRVAVAAVFPAESHAPIRYPAAAIAGPDVVRRGEAAAFVAFLHHDAARAILAAHGFGAPG